MAAGRKALLARQGASPFVVLKDTGPSQASAPVATRNVYVYTNVFSITEISTTGEVFNAYFYLKATWLEPDLSRAEDFNADTAWTPRFQFMNAVESPDMHDEHLEVLRWRSGPNREPVVCWSCKCRGTFRQQFELATFPFDAQDLHLTFSTHQTACLLHEDCYDGVKSRLRAEYTTLPEFSVEGPWLEPRKDLALGRFATMDIVFVAKRRFSFHLWNVFFPVFLLSAMQFAVFAVDVAEVADRLSVTLTLVLASVAYKYVVSQNLPNISYLTICDAYVLGSFVFMAGVVLQNTVAGFRAREDEGAAVLEDVLHRWIFGGVFVLAHVIYLIAVLLAISRQRHHRKSHGQHSNVTQ